MDDAITNGRAISMHSFQCEFASSSYLPRGELTEQATCKDFLQVQKDGSREVQRKVYF